MWLNLWVKRGDVYFHFPENFSTESFTSFGDACQIRSFLFRGATFLQAFTFALRDPLVLPAATAVLPTCSIFLEVEPFFLFGVCWPIDSFNGSCSLFPGLSSFVFWASVTCVVWLTFSLDAFVSLSSWVFPYANQITFVSCWLSLMNSEWIR